MPTYWTLMEEKGWLGDGPGHNLCKSVVSVKGTEHWGYVNGVMGSSWMDIHGLPDRFSVWLQCQNLYTKMYVMFETT